MTPAVSRALRNALRTTIILVVFAIIATALLDLTFRGTASRIERSQEAAKLALLNQVVPAKLYDNDLLASRQMLAPDARLGTRRASPLWIARRGGQVTAVALEAIAPDGYSGDIRLLIGIDASGTVTGVRVTEHRETPGLGDYIEHAKSNWIEQLTGRALDRPAAARWKPKKDGGAFDTRAGATITPRAVIKAVHRALGYFADNRARFVTPAPAEEKKP